MGVFPFILLLIRVVLEIIKYAGSERWFREAADFRVLRKAVIPAPGLGTRLLSVTKEQP